MAATTIVQGHSGRTLVFAMTGTPGDGPTAQVRIRGVGQRGATAATALYLKHNAAMLASFAERVRAVVERTGDRASIAGGQASLTVRSLRLTYGVEVSFRGRRGGYLWSDPLSRVETAALVAAIDAAVAHLTGGEA